MTTSLERNDRGWPTDINGWARHVDKWATSKGWNDEVVPFGDTCSLLHSEITEAYEEYRNHRDINELYYDKSGDKPEGIGIELADLMIRIFHFAGRHGLDLQFLIETKMLYNENRPYRHGGKKA